MSTIAYPEVNGNVSSVVIIPSANTPEFMNIPGVMVNPVISVDVSNAPSNHRKIVDGVIVLKTAEEIEAMDDRTPSEKRAVAYINETDIYLPILQSYEILNDSRLEALKAEFIAKREAISALYPDA